VTDRSGILGWAGIDNDADLILTHMKVDGEDIVFRNGNDSLRLRKCGRQRAGFSGFHLV